MFEITPIQEEPQSNPRLMSPPQIRSFARQGGGSVIADLVRNALVAGNRNTAASWPEPLRQQGASCQTIAIINGVRCYQAAAGKRLWSPAPDEIENIRYAASQQTSSDSPFAADSVSRILVKRGLLRSAEPMQQPITAAETMANGGFAVMTNGKDWHATTTVPNLARLATEDGYTSELISLDSLTGQQSALSAEQFCSSILELDWRQDQALICTVGSAALSV